MTGSLHRFWKSLRRAHAAQVGVLRSTYGWNQVELRETWIIIAWPKCTWSYRTTYTYAKPIQLVYTRPG